MKKLLLILFVGLVSFQSQASIEYKLRYNATTDMFEVSFVSTTSYAAANIGTSQATVVFDAAFNTSVIVTAPVNGGAWLAQDKVTGTAGALDTKKIVGFQTSGAPFVGAVNAGTEYVLFSFTFGPGLNCSGAPTFRLLVNSTDPTDPNGQGGDFTSYLNIGGVDEISTNSDATFLTCATAGPTPVRFLNFNASKNADNAMLIWNVANEDALTKYYVVERSINRIDFEPIQTILAKNKGVSVSSDSYDLTDANLSRLHTSGAIYYRIKQVDADGDFIYSEVRALRLNGKAFGVVLYPNPAKKYANVTIDLNDASPISIHVSDAAGKEIRRIEMAGLKGANIKRIDLSGLAAGSYMVKVHAGDQSQTIALLKGE